MENFVSAKTKLSASRTATGDHKTNWTKTFNSFKYAYFFLIIIYWRRVLRNVVPPKYFIAFSKSKTRSHARCSMGALPNPGSPRTADSTLPNFRRKKHFRQGRNNNVFSFPKHASIGEYRAATGFECLVGYWYLCKQVNRFEELMLKSEVVEYLETVLSANNNTNGSAA